MKLLLILLLFSIQSDFGTCYKCEFNNGSYVCHETIGSNMEENNENGWTDDDVRLINFRNIEQLTKQESGLLCQRFKNVYSIDIRGKKSFNDELFQQCMNLKEILIGFSALEKLPENIFSDLTSLTSMVVIFNSRLTTLPANIFLTQMNLRSLYLSTNAISCLPSNIFDSLTILKELDLHGNNIRSLNPKWFVNLHSLENLYLKENKIQDLPKNIFKNLKNLKKLDLWRNQLTTLHFESFETLKYLESLDVAWNKINSIDEEIINLEKINSAIMYGNVCYSLAIEGRNKLNEELQKCFDNYYPRVDPTSVKCGKTIDQVTLIHKGNITEPNEYPWNAALITKEGKLFCGGTVVSSRHIVTAAHCIKGKANEYYLNTCDFYVLLGAYDLKKDWEQGRVEMSVNLIYIHSNWHINAGRNEADIAMLELLNEINFSKYIKPICIPDIDSNVANVTRGIAVGFGITENGRTSDVAKKLEIPIYTYKNCTKHSLDHRYIAGSNSFCGGWADGSGVCSGDSGSGVYVIHKDTFYLRGIVSSALPTATGQCDVEREAIFMNVPKFYGFIKSGGLNENASNRAE